MNMARIVLSIGDNSGLEFFNYLISLSGKGDLRNMSYNAICEPELSSLRSALHLVLNPQDIHGLSLYCAILLFESDFDSGMQKYWFHIMNNDEDGFYYRMDEIRVGAQILIDCDKTTARFAAICTMIKNLVNIRLADKSDEELIEETVQLIASGSAHETH